MDAKNNTHGFWFQVLEAKKSGLFKLAALSNLLHLMKAKNHTRAPWPLAGYKRAEKFFGRVTCKSPCVFILLLGLLALPGFSKEHKRAGTEEFSFLSAQSYALPAGLAGAYTGYGEGLFSLSTNPAGLAALEGQPVSSVSFKKNVMDVNSGEVSHAFSKNKFVYAISMEYSSYGVVSQRDENNNPSGDDIYPMSSNPSFSMAMNWKEKFRFGGSFQLPMEYLGTFAESQTALGWGLDLGMQYQPNNKRFSFGTSLLNVGRQERHQIEGHSSGGLLPMEFRAGMAYRGLGNRQTNGVLDVAIPYHNFVYVNAGVEHNVSRGFTLRAGTRWNYNEIESYFREFVLNRKIDNPGANALKLSVGASIDQKTWGLDYAAQYWHNLGILHWLTLRMQW